ncbi:MAG: class I SAM-dependent methyltransferase [Candidatus Omnitrophica bacterium]|nr:class I SAM-dependent methyltransferase [Candidatus Omnitrophota bacterium]
MAHNARACRICGNTDDNKTHTAREMMFGMRNVFQYLECGSCGCVQLIDIPQDMSRYYPANYFSFKEPQIYRKFENDRLFTRFLRHRRSAYLFDNASFLGWVLSIVHPPQPRLLEYAQWFSLAHAHLGSRILDVGCGKGKMLSELAWYGFRNLHGADPFIDADIRAPGIFIHSCDIFSLREEFDMVMFNHSFEHMDDPYGILGRVREVLRPEGRVMIRIPTVSSYAWEHYGVNWVALDPPRHIFLYSLKSLDILARRTGFTVEHVLYDSTEYQFWASEQYIRDIPERDERSYGENPSKSIFTEEQIREFTRRAEELNREGRGDAICVFLSRIDKERT